MNQSRVVQLVPDLLNSPVFEVILLNHSALPQKLMGFLLKNGVVRGTLTVRLFSSRFIIHRNPRRVMEATIVSVLSVLHSPPAVVLLDTDYVGNCATLGH